MVWIGCDMHQALFVCGYPADIRHRRGTHYRGVGCCQGIQDPVLLLTPVVLAVCMASCSEMTSSRRQQSAMWFAAARRRWPVASGRRTVTPVQVQGGDGSDHTDRDRAGSGCGVGDVGGGGGDRRVRVAEGPGDETAGRQAVCRAGARQA